MTKAAILLLGCYFHATLAMRIHSDLVKRTGNESHTEDQPPWWGETKCNKQSVCLVTSNAAHEHGFEEIFQGCLAANEETEAIVLALQDFRGQTADLPEYYPNRNEKRRFKLRDQMMLSTDAGKGHLCHFKFLGPGKLAGALSGALAGAKGGGILGAKIGTVVPIKGTIIGGALGATIGGIGGGIAGYFIGDQYDKNAQKVGCGGVAVIVYALRKYTVSFEAEEEGSHASGRSDLTATTLKGTVALKIKFNERDLVVASTHASEGVRGKKRGSECEIKATDKEMKRVEDFRSGLTIIHSIMTENAGVLWGGNFNPRTVDPATGCPLFEGDINNLHRKEIRDILGAVPGPTGKELTTFTSELEAHATSSGTPAMYEVEMDPGELCPTYNKDKNREEPDKPQFKCHSPALERDMYYKYEKPPSWTDRIFKNSVEWLNCGPAKRINHEDDHDAVLASCEVASPACS